MDAGATATNAEPVRRRERGGRTARREQRSHGSEGLGRPYIVRNIPTYDILSEENLVRIEQTADRILAEIGIEFRDDAAALDHWKEHAQKLAKDGDVFFYFISGAKERNPLAAKELIEKLTP